MYILVQFLFWSLIHAFDTGILLLANYGDIIVLFLKVIFLTRSNISGPTDT